MKKYLPLGLLLICMLVVSGCQEKKDYVVKCTLSQNNVLGNYQIESTYEITTDGKIAKSVKTVEVVTSENETLLNTMSETLNTTYETMNNAYGGYVFDVDQETGKVVSTVTIDYTALDLEKLLSDQPSMKNYTNEDNQLTLEGLQNMYTTMGATCE